MNARDRFLAAARCTVHDRPPVWLMRQAGRYLPEYRELREKYEYLEILCHPELAMEASLQPWTRFGMDAVVLFSDILVPVRAMGVRFSFDEGTGPRLDRRISSDADVSTLVRPRVRTSLAHALEALEMVRHRVREDAAVIGSIGAPWTLACYLTEGGSGSFATAAAMARERPDALMVLLDFVTDVLADYAAEQVRSGADAIQIFDTWGGLLEACRYAELALPRVRRICEAVSSVGGIPILFIRESDRLLEAMRDSGAQVASLGVQTQLARAWEVLGEGVATQGNIDPEILMRSPAAVVAETKRLLEEIRGRPGHIVNLGHGVPPGARVECVKAMVETVARFGLGHMDEVHMPEAKSCG